MAARCLTLRAWANKYLVVADGPRAGRRWKPGGAPWVEVLDSCDDRTLEQVTIRGSVQSGKTATLIAAALGHFALGRSVLFYEPDHKLMVAMAARVRAWGRACRDPVVRDAWESPRPPRARTGATGGRLEILSAGEGGAGLMRTAEVVIVDELRVFSRDMLAELIDRMAAYGGRGRLITASSAGYQDECRTSIELGKSDARHWFVSCPACGQSTIARWESVKIPKAQRAGPRYLMPCCGASLGSVEFRRAVQAGEWRSTQAAPVPGTRGYHLDCFTSPFESLPTIVRTWIRANKHRKQTGSLADVIAFQCGRLALPYRAEPAQGVTPELIARTCRESYERIPAGASVLVGACDVQDNRLEAEVSAWGLVEVERDEAEATGLRGWESHEYRGLRHGGRWYRLRRWAIQYRRFPGDPGGAEVWEDLAAFMEAHREHESGVQLRPVIVGIDTGGHYTQQVADFVRTRGDGYQCLKGLPPTRFGGVLARRSITTDSLHDYGQAGLMLVCTNAGKASVFSLMRQSCAGADPSPMSWPSDESKYGPVEFEGICSESLQRTVDKRTGRTALAWKKTSRANEPLDVLVYSLALVSSLGIPFLLSERELIERASNAHLTIAA